MCPRLCPSGYNDTEQENNKECDKGVYFVQDNPEASTKEVCRFKRDILSLCSGLSDTNFGYSEGQPCVLLKMNRVKPNWSGQFFKSSRTSTNFPHLCPTPPPCRSSA